MKRSDFKITNTKVVFHLEELLFMQRDIARKEEDQPHQAWERYMTLNKLKKLIEVAEKKGFTIDRIISELKAVKVQIIKQGRLF